MAKKKKTAKEAKLRKAKTKQAQAKKTTKPAVEAALLDDGAHQPEAEKQVLSDLNYAFKLFGPSLQRVRQYLSVSLLFLVVPGMLTILGSTLTGDSKIITDRTIIGGLCTMVGTLWLVLNVLSSYVFTLRVGRQQEIKLWAIYRRAFGFVPRLMGFAVLFILVLTVALLAFIIPGVIVFRRYYMTPFYLIDNDCGIREAMQMSAAESKPQSYKVYSLLLVTVLLAVLSMELNRLFPPYGAVAGLLINTTFAYAPVILYLHLRQAFEARKVPVKAS